MIRNFFFLFPVIGSFVVFALDRWSYFLQDPFDPNFAIPGLEPFFWRSMVVFSVCWIPLTLCCIRPGTIQPIRKKSCTSMGLSCGPTSCEEGPWRRAER